MICGPSAGLLRLKTLFRTYLIRKGDEIQDVNLNVCTVYNPKGRI